MGLDDTIFGAVCSNILSMDALPSMNQAYWMIVREECHRTIARGKEDRDDAVSFVAITLKPNYGIENSQLICTVCKQGHDARNCFQLIGYPDWWGERNENSSKSSCRGKYLSHGRGRETASGGGAPVAAGYLGHVVAARIPSLVPTISTGSGTVGVPMI